MSEWIYLFDFLDITRNFFYAGNFVSQLINNTKVYHKKLLLW